MIEEEIKRRIVAHYAASSHVLLLSDLGADLRDAQLWPSEGDTRTLADVVSGIDGVTTVRDENQKAFIIAITEEKKHLAENVLKHRASIRILRRLPKSVLVAFCVNLFPEERIALQAMPPFKYYNGKHNPPDGFVEVEEKYRRPGVYIDDLSSLSSEEANQLADNFLAWCDANGLQQAGFVKTNSGSKVHDRPKPVASPSSKKPASNALERLLAAQSSDIASQIQIPADIALALSRLP